MKSVIINYCLKTEQNRKSVVQNRKKMTTDKWRKWKENNQSGDVKMQFSKMKPLDDMSLTEDSGTEPYRTIKSLGQLDQIVIPDL